jgi:hypothetical protein
MIENPEKQKVESVEEKFNPFSVLAFLFYYPALGLAIRMGFYTYFYLFDNLKGIVIIGGIVVTMVITVIYIIIVLFFINFLFKLSDKIWKLIILKKESKIEPESDSFTSKQ